MEQWIRFITVIFMTSHPIVIIIQITLYVYVNMTLFSLITILNDNILPLFQTLYINGDTAPQN